MLWPRLFTRRHRPAVMHAQGTAGIVALGHRQYVGGLWDEMGQLQFEFLLARGLQPHSYLLDIGCGSLRLGVRAIPYLDPGHYLGIDKEEDLLRAGLDCELSPRVREARRPNLVVSSTFEFAQFNTRVDFAIAQSLFTHMPAASIRLCFRNLRPWMAPAGVFFATYFASPAPCENPSEPHDHGYFAYTAADMVAFGEEAGYVARHLGHWNHPRGQQMVEYRPAS
jgi:SAM-dependent methyltransferase